MPLLEYQTADGYLGIALDVVEREGYEATAETTDHAVDSGVVVSDHVKRNPTASPWRAWSPTRPSSCPRRRWVA